MGGRRPLTDEELQRLEAKVAEIEARSTARIEVAIVRREWLGLEHMARRLLERHGRRGLEGHPLVLILLVTGHRQFLIRGDEAVHAKVGQDFWQHVRERMLEELREGRLYDGLATGIQLLGDALMTAFPEQGGAAPEAAMRVLLDA